MIPPPCPPRCETDHSCDLEIDDVREHAVTVWTLHRADHPEVVVACVTVATADNLSDGSRALAEILVSVRDGLDAGEARGLALAILDGIDYLEVVDQ